MSIKFYQERDTPYSCFSSFSRHSFAIDGMPWQTVKDGIMRCAVRAKFAQHADIRAILVATGYEELIEVRAELRAKKEQSA